MTREEYLAAIAEYKSDRLEHGGQWKKHKYIRIENGRYIYPEDEKKSSSVGQKTPVALGGRNEHPEYESHRDRTDSYQTTKSYQDEARAAGRKATQEYKSGGQTEAKSSATTERPKGDIRDLYKDKTVPVVSGKTAAKLQDYQGYHDSRSKTGLDSNKVYKKLSPQFNERIASLSKELEEAAYNCLKNCKTQEDLKKFMHDGSDELDEIFDKFDGLANIADADNVDWDEGKAVNEALESSIIESAAKAIARAQKEGIKIPEVSEFAQDVKNFMSQKSRAITTDNKKIDPRHFKHGFYSRDDFYAAVYDYQKEHSVEHHGILGQKWGIRRYQNADGSLTEAGKKRMKKVDKYAEKAEKKIAKAEEKGNTKKAEKIQKKLDRIEVANALNDHLYDQNVLKTPKANRLGVDERKILNKGTNIGQFLGGPIGASIGYHIAAKPLRNMRLTEALNALHSTEYGRKLLSTYASKWGEDPAKAVKNSNISMFYKKQKDLTKKNNEYRMNQYDNDVPESEKQKVRANTQPKDSGSINDKVAKARNTGRYDLEFVERTQNSERMETDQKLVDSEYRKYLKDPQNYRYAGR